MNQERTSFPLRAVAARPLGSAVTALLLLTGCAVQAPEATFSTTTSSATSSATSAPTPAAPDPAALRARVALLLGVVQPVTAAEVAAPRAVLGRALFWDTRLSLDGKTACASCHAASDHSSDSRRFSINARGLPTTMQSQPVFMSMDQVALRWYGDRTDGAHQAERSITGSMGLGSAAEMVPLLRRMGYEAAFAQAFGSAGGDPVTARNYALALQDYQRTLRNPAPIDAFLQGDDRALSAQQRSGLEKFVATGCTACHGGALLGGQSMQKFGLTKDYWLATGSNPPDLGRFNATKKEEDRYVFRVPMLRNVERTAPYFHDGSVSTLPQAVRVMAEVQLGRQLPEADVADIVAFLGALTGPIPAHYAPPVFPAAQVAGTRP